MIVQEKFVSLYSYRMHGISCSNFAKMAEKPVFDVSMIRSYNGVLQNRLEHKISNLNDYADNTYVSDISIRDTEMASLMIKTSNSNILRQAGTSILTQANQTNERVLALLR